MFLFSRRTLRPLLLAVPALALGAFSSPTHAQAPVSASAAATNKAELVNLVKEYSSDNYTSKVVAGLNFKLSAAAWKVLLTGEGPKSAAYVVSGFSKYGETQKLGDLRGTNDAGEIDDLVAALKSKINLTVEATQPKLSPTQGKLLLRYMTFVAQAAGDDNWTPRGGRANLKLILSSSAKDIAVSADKTATNFTVIAPIKEPDGWDGKIERGLKRFAK